MTSRFVKNEYYCVNQKDIYFKVPDGRLKLRIINSQSGELIFYKRKESKKIRVSNYIISRTKDFKNLSEILSVNFEILVIVKKKRKIFIFDNIRIHLDKVENLGEFLEFEIVYDNYEQAKKQMKFLINYFKLNRNNFINNSYSDLLIEKLKQKGK